MVTSNEFEDPTDMPCCASQPSCCRWCPEIVCARLEMSQQYVESLYWALCGHLDEGERKKRDLQRNFVSNMNQLVESGQFWDPKS